MGVFHHFKLTMLVCRCGATQFHLSATNFQIRWKPGLKRINGCQCSGIGAHINEEFCARSRYKMQGKVITPHRYCGCNYLYLPLIPAFGARVLKWSAECICIYAATSTTVYMSHRSWNSVKHDDVIKWKHFPRYWPFVRGIHRSPVNSPHKGQWRGALMLALISIWINGWVTTVRLVNRDAIVVIMTS